MLKKILICLTIIILISPILSATDDNTTEKEDDPYWNDEWDFRSKIVIPIDTGDENAKFQPIDININFTDICWAKNSKEHSIRVIYQKGEFFKELESQIYDLNFSGENIIDNCNLVFLIPEEADGNEVYYLYYDDEEKDTPGYDDHVTIKESYYHLSISYGLSTESWNYDIVQDGFIEYAIIKRGEAVDGFLSQKVIKFIDGAREYNQQNYKHASSYSFRYWWYDGEIWDAFSTNEKLLRKDILIDGNLMVKCAVVSSDNNERIKTTGIYTYYFCPVEDKRIFAHIKHEIIDYSIPSGEKVDVTYGEINVGSIDSSREDLNYGKIPPFFHYYSENGRILSYDLDTNPEYTKWKYIIKDQYDVDLGEIPWVSLDYGKEGEAQSIILNSNNIIKSGKNEPDGIQIVLLESNGIQLPNLDIKRAELYMNRNSYEGGEEWNSELPKDYIVEYKAEFFSTENGGYKAVEKEAEIYQKLVDFKPETENNLEDSENDSSDKSLTVYAHFPGLFSPGIFTYVNAELYYENVLLDTEDLNRITIKEGIDWKNISLFRKATFNNLKEGKYFVKIIVKNLFSENNDKFVGYKIIDLEDTMKTHIFCGYEGTHNFLVHNQNKDGIKGAQIQFLSGDVIIFEGSTDSDGKLKAGLPCGIGKTYDSRILYKGFLIDEEQVDFGLIRSIIPSYKNLSVELYPLHFEIIDREKTGENIDISLTSKNMFDKQNLTPDDSLNDKYTFLNLPRNDYILRLNYNNFQLEKNISLTDEITTKFDLYDLSVNIFDRWNATPDTSFDFYLTSEDFVNKVVLSEDEISDNNYLFKDLFSGNYSLELYYKSQVIKKKIRIPYDKEVLSFDFSVKYNLSTNFYDSHGHLIKDIKLEMSRDGASRIIKSNNKGDVLVSLPPGTYSVKIYSNDQLISKRNISVISDIDLKIVTKKEPIYPFFTTISIILFLFLAGFYFLRKRKIIFYLKIVVVALVILSIVFPWWALSGASPEDSVDTKSNLFLHNSNIITVTTHKDTVYGNFGLLGEDFDFAVSIIVLTIALGLSFFLLNMIFRKFYYNNLASLFLLLSFLGFIASIVISYIAISSFAEVIVGGFLGSDTLNISLLGNGISTLIPCNWGPSIGFYLFLAANVIVGILIFYKIKNISIWKK